MPEKETLRRAEKKRREGKAPTTQAGEFVREEIHHVREGKHGARSAKQAIAIGLSKARRAGVKIPDRRRPGKGAQRATAAAAGKSTTARARKKSPRRAQASKAALKREGRSSASRAALSKQARQASRRGRQASRGRKRTQQKHELASRGGQNG
jgi:Family of unknown function (DUF6496)